MQQSNPILQLPLYPPPSETLCATDTDFKRDMELPPRNFNVARSYSSYPVKPPEDHQFNAISLPIEKMILPSEVLHIPISNKMPIASHVSITPSFPNAYDNILWRPQICDVINGEALFKNHSSQPLLVPKYAHFKPHSVHIMSLEK